MIKLYGRATSSNVQHVLWCLAELGLEYEREDRGHSYGGVDTPEYLAMNPNGLVPVLVDGDDAPLFESAAITRYLASKYGDGGAFWPSDPAKRAQVDKWAEWGKVTWAHAVGQGVFWPLVRTSPKDRDPAKIEAAMSAMNRAASLLNGQLSTRPYIAGDTFTLADLATGYMLYRYFTIDFERSDFPAISAYYDRLQTRAAFRDHVMISYEVLRAPGA